MGSLCRTIPCLFVVTRFDEVSANFEQEREVTKSEMACTLFSWCLY